MGWFDALRRPRAEDPRAALVDPIEQALRALGFAGTGLKWPNDLVVDGRKLGGVLVEGGGEHGGPVRAIIGIGINVCMPADAAAAIGVEIGQIVKSLIFAVDGDVVLVWSTKFPAEGTWFDRDEWAAFIAGAKDCEFDLPAPAVEA